MRTVYVDVLIAVNIFIDFFLILCAKRFLKLRAKLWRMILGSAAGGALSLAALLPKLPFFVNIPLDLISACLIVFAAFGKTDVKSFLKRVVVYFSVSFSFCGIMIFAYSLFKPQGMAVFNDVVYFDISPVVLIILTLVCYYALKLIKKFTEPSLGKIICSVSVSKKEATARFRAVVDSGCNVREPFSGEYVIITEKENLSGLCFEKNRMRIIPFDSLGGKGIIEGYRADRILIDGSEVSDKIYIGVCSGILKGDIRAIVPHAITANIN